MKTAHFIKKDITFSQDLSSAPLSYTTTVGRKFKLEEIIFRASQAITETITITRVSAQGSAYNTVLRTMELTAERDYVYRPTGEANFLEDDEIKVECTNANGVGTIRGILRLSEM